MKAFAFMFSDYILGCYSADVPCGLVVGGWGASYRVAGSFSAEGILRGL